MNIKLELLKEEISYYVTSHLDELNIDVDEIVDSAAVLILAQIKEILQNDEYTDFDIVEKIVELFEQNGIDCGGCHDFG
ncbi:MAG: hypothetical protein IJA60_01810 [Clostridia bacterium]|nr:hypothetical protein [Clostridia bacterium]